MHAYQLLLNFFSNEIKNNLLYSIENSSVINYCCSLNIQII